MKISKINWEESNYGGFIKIIENHGYIDAPFDLEIDLSEKHGSFINDFNGRKLIKMFLLDQKDSLKNLVLNVEEYEEKSFFRTETRLKLTKVALKLHIEQSIKKNLELSSLYEYYSDVIENSIISIPKFKKTYGSFNWNSGKQMSEKEEKIENSFEHILSRIEKYTKKNYDYITRSDNSCREVIVGFFDAPLSKTRIKYDSMAEDLYKLLLKDCLINTDPGIVKFNHLRSGILDTILISQSLCHKDNIFFRKDIINNIKPFSVVLLLDYSGSMVERDKILKQKQITLGIVKFFRGLSKDINVYAHSGGFDAKVYHIYRNGENEDYINFEGIDYQQNYDGHVIKELYKRIKQDGNLLILTISDGFPCGETYGGSSADLFLTKEVERIKRDGVIVAGIGLDFNNPKLYHYSTNLDAYNINLKQISTLINRIVQNEYT